MMVAVPTTVALLLTALALAGYEVVNYRRAIDQKLVTVADIVGRNSTAALTFGDAGVARDILGALEAEPTIQAGVIFDRHRPAPANRANDRPACRVKWYCRSSSMASGSVPSTCARRSTSWSRG
jgi:hypothetical protein